ncbi:phosphonate ABC transporter, permease protein PhnE, partial [Burkholderia thailandensis]|nr:phosphonate ABC transporter, permease protein PhnE [Burkholderia thailandensis]
MNAREPAGAALGEPLATAAAARGGWRAWLAWALAFAILGGPGRSADMRPLDLL